MNKIGVLICNGPSLADVPVRWLNEHVTLASNSFYAKEGLVPDYWFLEGRGHLRMRNERIARAHYMHLPRLILVNSEYAHCEEFSMYDVRIQPITYWHRQGVKISGFHPRPSITGHGTANSVTYAMLQYAFEWDFDPLLIVGMDMKFSADGHWHFYDQADVPEFHEMDYQRFLKWRDRAEASYQECADYFADHGRTVLNLTPGTACEAFKLDRLENWL